MQKVAVFVGSLRSESINLRFAKALERLAESKLEFVYPDLGSLPLYNDDLWANPPESVVKLKDEIASADAVLFVTPEYIRTIPSVLSNAIFWGARPWGQNSWADKPGAVVGTSPGLIGTAVAQSHLRSVLTGLEIVLLGQPEIYFQTKPGLINDNFEVTDEQTAAFLKGWADKFAGWIDRHTDHQASRLAAE